MSCLWCGRWRHKFDSARRGVDTNLGVVPGDSPCALPPKLSPKSAPETLQPGTAKPNFSLDLQPPTSQAGSHISSATFHPEHSYTNSFQEPQRASPAPSSTALEAQALEAQAKSTQKKSSDPPGLPLRSPDNSPRPSLSRNPSSGIQNTTSTPTSERPEFRPPLRSKTFSPQFSDTVKVIILTQLKDHKIEDEPLTLQRNVPARENYTLIEEKKSFADKYCNANQELQLAEGKCTISCACEPCSIESDHQPLDETLQLETFQDWEEVEAVTADYEHKGHTNVRITIARKLRLVEKMIPPEAPRTHAIHRFRLQLHDAMVREEEDGVKPYIPKDELERLTRREVFDYLVQDPTAEFRTPISDIEGRRRLAERIHHDAHLLLLMIIYCCREENFKLLEDMLDHQKTGKIPFPLPRQYPEWLKKDNASKSTVPDYEADDLRMAYDICYRGQWAFQAAVFENKENQKLDNDIIVPYLWKEKIDSGAYSTVYKVKIHHSHQKLYQLPQENNPELALKAVKRGSDIHEGVTNEAFKNEQLILKGLHNLDNDYIIKLLGTYYQGEYCYFIFPLANCNLDKYMRANDPEGFMSPDSKTHKDFLAWIWSQMEGLADGLSAIHVNPQEDPKQSKDRATRPLVSPKFLDENVAREARPGVTGYHHDIKPQNILYFSQDKISQIRNPIPPCGLLQIADFGIGRFHSERSGTGLPSKGTSTPRGTPTYAAPESKVPVLDEENNDQTDSPPLKLSRPYDVWSFGCLLMEVLVWVVDGSDGRTKFADERDGPADESQPQYENGAFFLVTKERRTVVRDSVKDRLRNLREHRRIKTQPQGSLAKALDIVESVLEVNPEKRPTAHQVAERLSVVAESAKCEAKVLEIIDEVQAGASPVPSLVCTDVDDSAPSPPRQVRHSRHAFESHRSAVAGNSSRSQSPPVWDKSHPRTNTASTGKSVESGTSTTVLPSMSRSTPSSRPVTPR